MKKRALAFFLILLMILPVTGCNIAPAETTGTGNTSAATTLGTSTIETTALETTAARDPKDYPMYVNGITFVPDILPAYHEGDYTLTVQYVPETVENPQNLPVLKLLYLCQERRDLPEEPVAEVNQTLADMGMPYRLQVIFVRYNHPTSTEPFTVDYFALPEVRPLLSEADLVCGIFNKGDIPSYFSPITEYVTGEAQPSLKNAAAHSLVWESMTIDGEIYCAPSALDTPDCHGWGVDTAFLQEYGLTAADFQKEYWEMDELFAAIYQKNGGQPFLSPYFTLATRPNNYAYGIEAYIAYAIATLCRYQYVFADYILELRDGTPTAMPVVESEDFRKIQEATIRYLDAGYVAFINTSLPAAEQGQDIKITYQVMSTSEPYAYDSGQTLIPVTDLLYAGAQSHNRVLGIAKTSAYKDQAVSLLNLLAEDKAFRFQLCYGREGRDYGIEDGRYYALDREDGTRYDLHFLLAIGRLDEPGSYLARDGMTSLETFQKDMDSVALTVCPVTLDYTAFEEDLIEYKKVMDKYYPLLANHEDRIYTENGTDYWAPRFDSELYEQMLQELKAAGSDRIKAELQAQLDVWLADHPDWTAKVS